MKRTLFAVMALLASGAALADECSSANTQTEMNQCAAAQYQAADKKLNDTWQQALQRAVGKQQTLLKQAQQAWIALRDADCAFLASGAEGGSMQPMLVSQCMTDKSVERSLSSPRYYSARMAIKAARCRPPINGRECLR